jgi:hypothetical protein
MDVAKIISILTTGSKLIDTVIELATSARGQLSMDDAVKLDEALAAWQTKNDETYTRVQAKLAAAVAGE